MDNNSNQSDNHPVWKHLVKAGDQLADMLVDITAIAAIAVIAVQGVGNGVSVAAAQILGGMIATIAIGKRYYQSQEAKKP